MGQQRQPFDRRFGRLTTQLRAGLLSDGVRIYTYTHANRLTQVVSGTFTTQFAYPSTLLKAGNGAGDRVARTVDGVTTSYVLDPAAGLTQVLQETTGGQTTSYLYGADLLAQSGSGTWAYHLKDGLGSVRQLADPTGQMVAGYSFSPFGVPLGESGGEPYGFTGEQWDASTGPVYLRARYYSPEVGRFTQRDPWRGDIWRPGTLLRGYVYVSNRPVTFRDPSGCTDCSSWPSPFRWMCEQADTGDLNAIDLLYNLIALYADFQGEDYPLAGIMLRHYLQGNGNDLDLPWYWGRHIGEDPNIADAANLLFNAFILNDVKPAAQGVSVASVVGHYDGLDFYTWEGRPRPQSPGLFGAIGHVAVDGDFKADARLLSGSCKYLVKFTADYSINDRYEWFAGTETHFGNVFGKGDVIVPHNWAIALRDATPARAHEYNFSVKWRDRGRLLVESDWTDWRHLKWWEVAQ